MLCSLHAAEFKFHAIKLKSIGNALHTYDVKYERRWNDEPINTFLLS